jgi:NitT/TauT family transport system ATP-binding protein
MALTLDIRDLKMIYRTDDAENDVVVFDGLDCRVRKGEFLSIVGPSGSGKTTLLRIIAGLEQATSGEIDLDGKQLNPCDPRVGMVFQEFALFPWRSALGNIEMGLELKGVPKDERRAAAMQYIRAFGLEGFEAAYPGKLSGGMKQRVAIARTLINNPEIVLMDEPFGALDSQTRNGLQEFLLRVWQDRRDTILFVTHNVDEAVYLSDRIIVLGKRPSRIETIVVVSLERPRDRTGREANLIRKKILSRLAAS